MSVLTPGATGHIGGRLPSRLVERGIKVRLLVRDARHIPRRWWADEVDVVTGDLSDAASLERAVDGVERAYYLVHSMTHVDDFAERDHIAARDFVQPRGLIGLLYWYAMFPAHLVTFGDMAKVAARLALKEPVAAVESRLGATA